MLVIIIRYLGGVYHDLRDNHKSSMHTKLIQIKTIYFDQDNFNFNILF